MSYKTILAHVGEAAPLGPLARIAATLATGHDAWLVGVATTGLKPSLFFPEATGAPVSYVATVFAERRRRANLALQAFEAAARDFGASRVETRVAEDEAGAGLCAHARYSDLVVLNAADPHGTDPFQRADFPEYVVLHSGKPVLVLPPTKSVGPLGTHVMVAWDASAAAGRAVTAALPLLKTASVVEVVVFDSDRYPHGERPGEDIALFLKRHAVEARVSLLYSGAHETIGKALLEHALESSASLIVMGAYGHPRLEEIILGGVTRAMLRAMQLPLLMMH